VGVRLEPGAPVVFCYTAIETLERGQRVTVAGADGAGVREGVVTIAPPSIIAAPPLGGAPRVVGVAPAGEAAEEGEDPAALPPGSPLLAPEDSEIGPADLRQALLLAALPIPEAPPERRRSPDGDR